MYGINIYIGRTEDFKFFDNLPMYAKERIRKIENERVLAEKRAGFGVLDFALSHIGIEADIKKCFLGETEKPLHEDFYFSISHSSGLVCVAVSLNGSVGIDIESCKNKERTQKLKDKILNEKEKEKDMLLLWTQKEAVFKYAQKEKTFIPKKIDTTKYDIKSINFFCGEKEFILSVVSENVSLVNYFFAPSLREFTYKIL